MTIKQLTLNFDINLSPPLSLERYNELMNVVKKAEQDAKLYLEAVIRNELNKKEL